MGQLSRSTTRRREGQLQALIAAAERRIATGGVAAMKARDLAQDIGVAVGALYNLVPDLDALGMLVASRTLARLEACVVEVAGALPEDARRDSVRCLTVFAHAYRAFASENLNLWRALFEHRTADRRPFPEALVADQMRLFAYITGLLLVLRPAAGEQELLLLSRTLYGAVHGVVALGLDEKLVAVTVESLDRQLELLVSAFCKGL